MHICVCTSSFEATIIVEQLRASLLMHVNGDIKCLVMVLGGSSNLLNHLPFDTDQHKLLGLGVESKYYCTSDVQKFQSLCWHYAECAGGQ